MTVATKTIPNYTTQTAAQYKANIDGAFSAHDRLAGAFAPHQMETGSPAPDLAMTVDAGALFVSGALVELAAQTVTGFTVPSAGQERYDRVVINQTTGVASRIAGTASTGSPSAGLPAITAGNNPCCYVRMTNSTPVVTNSMIVDERAAAAASSAIPQWTITASRGANAETFTVTPIAGASLRFRNATIGTGDYTDVAFSSAITLTFSSGSTMGQPYNNYAFRLWLVAFNDAGTLRLGAVKTTAWTLNTESDIMALRPELLYSSTAEGGAGAADSAQVIYSTTAVTTKAIAILGYAEYSLAAVGTWNTAPTKIQVYGPGVSLPGEPVQFEFVQDGATATGTTTVDDDDTIPQNTQGTQFMSKAITPTSACNVVEAEAFGIYEPSTGAVIVQAIFVDSVADAIAATMNDARTATTFSNVYTRVREVTNGIAARTYKVRCGPTSAVTVRFNGSSGGRKMGGVMASHIKLVEIMV